jgi:heme/copper-type cytochrome/quinol oxidase subunit 2
MGIQDQFTPIGLEAAWFHNVILLPLITFISLIVLLLLLYVIVRYRRAAHPVPSRTTHNTFVEIIWTVIPVLVLVAIAVPSIRLLAHQYSPPKADLTVKGDRQPMVLDLRISGQWRVRNRLETAFPMPTPRLAASRASLQSTSAWSSRPERR